MRFFSTLFCCAWFLSLNAQQVVINEVVTEPKFDYSTSNYSETTSEVNVTDVDEWLELLILENGLDLSSWTIELLDGTDVIGNLSDTGAFQTSKYISSSGGTFIDTDSGDFLVLGNVRSTGSMSNTITIRLKDNLGNLVDEVSLSSDPSTAPLGNSSSALDEAVARIPDGQNTNNDAYDFTQTRATPGTANSKRGKVVINELVTESIRDWSAANYTYLADSIGTFSSIDDWVELYILEDNLNLARWQIQLSSTDNIIGDLSDTGAFQFSKYLSNTEGSSFYKTGKGDYLLLANVNGSARQLLNTGEFILKNAFGETIDQVRLDASNAPNGNSSTMLDESVARIPNGIDTDVDPDDFTETFATPGFKNVYGKIERYRKNALQLNSDSVIMTWLNDSLENEFAISLWIKPEMPLSGQKILSTKDGNILLALNADKSIRSELTGTTVTSLDTVSSMGWNHIVLQKSTNQFSLFLNGKLEQSWSGSFLFNTTDTIIIGPLNARLEELQVWKTPLSIEKIRSNMRLTQSAENENLLHYYQFNNLQTTEPISGTKLIYGSSVNINESEAPVSYGVSQNITVNAASNYFINSTVEDHSLQLSFSGTLPNGDVIISFVEEEPNLQPKGLTYNDGVWIVDNYGNNSDLSAKMAFDFPEDYMTTTDTSAYFLYKRKSNAVGGWTEYKSAANSVILTNSKRQVQFSEIESFSQFIIASNVSPLPIHFLDFYLTTKTDILKLFWSIQDNKNTAYFSIEKSTDAQQFTQLDSVPSKCRKYSSKPYSEMVYFRISAVNFNGKKEQSKIIVAPVSEKNTRISVYPNPTNGSFFIEGEGLTKVKLYKTSGSFVLAKKAPVSSSKIEINGLPKDIYFLEINTKNTSIVKKIIVQ